MKRSKLRESVRCYGRLNGEVNNVLAMRILDIPVHATQVNLPKVRMLEKTNPISAPTTTKTAVQALCLDTAFIPMERLRMADPVMKI